ncbi:MAG: tRNA (N6-threonylcarbamoyladenosine(37)-N6)-methyltransferase TrmO [Syntrophomonas sp.]|uniref:tRNA (N6-threonylcarbamoyladenosine(37)-N6)-methyltransferase TrmO n=1 Tax=Syntrophomonas sp. TaxID=2053627 RepID=UPI002606354A|nr:tRNA (N6-threonylcarbamoyladenosine(37)-N6)-methyltransferase TrmO [Syntrophomonas sp.]MDD2510941.1 tRNA (N6-threonylcarbamoyladenosine(37)-N6)-methyltransferase TrmO [Syntrophomonas sp.]MDD3879249.1 tRNA (N6-threonylcarbamoyladenosine(37)-N6)-methyltransferase TrmO [Syntrophomonas sp.]MDD4626978.1 tRNA (N6-threonylcarbamoyladenosine(37)-N6)-methyltransferase TrmO [Syntrophomonas sp.]
MEEIVLKPVGQVLSSAEEPEDMPLGGLEAVIEIFPEYLEALKGIEENSHIWVLSWFHKAPRDLLRVKPGRINPELPEYGVFALRAYGRPNPIGLSLARLERVEGHRLYLKGLDAIGGTPVIDIKPYFENDAVFSPLTSYIKGKNREIRQGILSKRALVHHQEECRYLPLAVRMAIIAEDYLGKLNSLDLFVRVRGSVCLADCIQGISRARLANPPRFSFQQTEENMESEWKRGKSTLLLRLKSDAELEGLELREDQELFHIEYRE